MSEPLDFSLPVPLPEQLPVLPLRSGAILPGFVGPLPVGRARSLAAVQAAGRPGAPGTLVLVAIQTSPVDVPTRGDLRPVAVLARVLELGQAPGRPPAVALQGLARVALGEVIQEEPWMLARFAVDERPWPATLRAEALRRSVRDALREAAPVFGNADRVNAVLSAALPPALHLDAGAACVDASVDWRLRYLETADPLERAEMLLRRIQEEREVATARTLIQERLASEAQQNQKENILRAQLKAIQEELGDADDQLDSLRARLAARPLPAEARATVDRELARLARLRDGSPERSVALDWLEWVAELPWGTATARATADLDALEAALDRSHHGLSDVKRQVLEHLAVRQLAGQGRADVLLLVGPPGVGKTSIGQAIADATGRTLVRVALGGVRDEAEIRGHRRTYVGARPGRVVEGLRRAGAADPVILLDEIDKLGSGWQGDPAAALLELLDPEQNHAFTDRYLELPFDCSKVLFVATANDLSAVPAPLRDRMEVIPLDGYTRGEKRTIARGHLLPTLARNAGVEPEAVEWSDAALDAAIAGWTREAGVRGLQRTLGKVYRAAAVLRARGRLDAPLRVEVDDLPKYLGRQRFFDEEAIVEAPRVGVVNGLAWTPVGGEVLTVEAQRFPGGGKLVLTGQLGEVMKESARAALTYALAHADALGIDPAAAAQDLHIHVPAGAVPKDGPSAGVTMFTAITSLLSGRPVRADVAMTGEATLRGRVLPVGGIKSKVLAAHRAGLRTVVLPRRNGPDLEDLPAEVRAALTVHLVDTMDEVLAVALAPDAAVGANGPPTPDIAVA